MSDEFDAALRAMAARAADDTRDGRTLVTPDVTVRTRRRRRLHDAAVAGASAAAVVGVVLAGAAVAEPRPEPVRPATVTPTQTSATTSPSPSPSRHEPAPSPTATRLPAPEAEVVAPAAPPELGSLVITAAGLGPLALGSALPVAPAADDVVRFDAEACAGTDRPERWVAAYPVGSTASGAPGDPFTVWDDGGRAVRIQVLTEGPRTTGGIGVGSTLSELRAAHPEMSLLVSGATDVDVWGVRDGARSLVVEVSSNAAQPGRWSDDQVDRVLALVALAGAPDASYFPAWGGDTCG